MKDAAVVLLFIVLVFAGCYWLIDYLRNTAALSLLPNLYHY
jgi:hypothetical protein